MQTCQTFLKPFLGMILLLLDFTPSATSAATITKILATGKAAISEGMPEKARRYALEDALYMAALKAGADISSTAVTSQGVLVRDVIKLDTNASLVDFSILGEKNTGTHYEVKLNAFFAARDNKYCHKPRYPSVTILAPSIRISETVDFRYKDFAELIAIQLKNTLEGSYAGPISATSSIKLGNIQNVKSKNLSFDYESIQSGNFSSTSVDGDYLVDTSIAMQMDGRRIENHVELSLLKQPGFEPLLTLENKFVANLPFKTPLRSVNVLWPKLLSIEQNEINQMTHNLFKKLNDMACQQLEAKIVLASNKLKLGIGTKAGVKNGSLAYVTQGKESWTLLEVSSVTESSTILKPINNVQNIKRLANQRIRFIEGALR